MAEEQKSTEAEYRKTQLDTIAGGKLPELFQYELDRILANIDDLNAEAKDKRKITIELTFTPDGSRQAVGVEAVVKSKLSAPKAAEGVIFVVRDRKGDPFAVDSNPHQPELFRG